MNDTPDLDVALANLRIYAHETARWDRLRNPLVLSARRAGASWDQIITNSTLSRGTIRSIFANAGLTGDKPHVKDDSMQTLPSAATTYRHHPHYQAVTLATHDDHDHPGFAYVQADPAQPLPVIFVFTPFTGCEAQPTVPDPTEQERTGSAEDRLRAALRIAEFETAACLWRAARHTARLTALLADASKTWPAYVRARNQMDQRYAELGQTSRSEWLQALFRLLEAQEKALTLAAEWDQLSTQVQRTSDARPFRAPDYWDLAEQLGLADHVRTWDLFRSATDELKDVAAAREARLQKIDALTVNIRAQSA